MFILFIVIDLILIHNGFIIPCLFRVCTGYKCPGCGITHMGIHLIQGKFMMAYHDNPLLMIILPVFLIILVRYIYLYIKTGRTKLTRLEDTVLWLIVISLVLFGIIRNIYGF